MPGLIAAEEAAALPQELAERGWLTCFLAAQLHITTHTLAAIRG
ncbi:hypothetical protein ACIPJK_31460 [Streptomyces roseus]